MAVFAMPGRLIWFKPNMKSCQASLRNRNLRKCFPLFAGVKLSLLAVWQWISIDVCEKGISAFFFFVYFLVLSRSKDPIWKNPSRAKNADMQNQQCLMPEILAVEFWKVIPLCNCVKSIRHPHYPQMNMAQKNHTIYRKALIIPQQWHERVIYYIWTLQQKLLFE